MKNVKKIFIVLSVIALVVISIYYLYPKSSSFSNLILKNCQGSNITKIRMTSSYDDKYRSIKDINEINKLLSDLSKIKIVEFKENTNIRSDYYYDFAISTDKDNNLLEVIVYDTNYITIDNIREHNLKTYRIIDNGLNKDYLKELIENK